MFTTASRFTKFLRENNLVNEIYEAMENDDYSEVVMAAIASLNKGNISLRVNRENKCEHLSDTYRNEGNVAFKKGDKLLAMHAYNKALRYAPNNSRAMLLAYSNRSAVLFKAENFTECLSDIETCFRLGCPSDIVDKLNHRKESATAKLALAKVQAPSEKLFQIELRNRQVPCASADVNIVVNDGEAKITAAKNIKVGTTLAVESCYVGSYNYKILNNGTACRNCFGKSFNLIPCDGCCYIMFCSEKCKRKCQFEYHGVECQIMEVIEATDFRPRTMLMVAGALKFVKKCNTWKVAIAESLCTGTKRRCVSKPAQMFDVDNKLSILNYEEDKIFVYGNMYETSFVCAQIIDGLDKLPSFFPRLSGERVLAKRAFGRIMMYLALYAKPTQALIIQRPSSRLTGQASIKFMYHGLYPFIGKLPNSCTPNTIISHAGNKSLLIALHPITKGSELTVSHMGHYLDSNVSLREKNFESLSMYGRVCKCFICTDEWKTRDDVLTEEQIAAYKKYLIRDINSNAAVPPKSFQMICDTLACLSSAPFSKEYVSVYADFRDRIMTNNFLSSS